MKLNTLLFAVSLLSSAVSFAGAPVFGPKTRPEQVKLTCPEGTVQYGGMNTTVEGFVCQRTDASKAWHGPYVVFWLNGTIQAEGTYENGRQVGHWVFYDKSGVKTQETDFKDFFYHGSHVEFYPNGKKKLEATYVNGRREGIERRYDLTGKLLAAVEFRDDRPIVASTP